MHRPTLQRPHRLEQTLLKTSANTHGLAGGFHLRSEGLVRVRKFVKWEPRHLRDYIVESGFEAGGSICKRYLIQCETHADFGGYACNRIAGRLGCERGGTGDPGIDLNQIVLERIRVECELDVTASFHLEGTDYLQRTVAQHMIFPVRQRLRGTHDDGIAGVNTDGVQIFHVADGDGGVICVADYFVLDLLVALDTLFDEDLTNRRKFKPGFQQLLKLRLTVGKSTAGSAQREGRTEDDRISDFLRGSTAFFHAADHDGRKYRLAESLAESLELFTVLGHLYTRGIRSEKFTSAFGEDAFFLKLHGKIEACLAADAGENRVGSLAADDSRDIFKVKRFHIYPVCNRLVRHDSGGVGIAQDDFIPLFFEREAGLCARVVKLGGLPDDDRAGAYDQDFVYICSFRHDVLSSILSLLYGSSRQNLNYFRKSRAYGIEFFPCFTEVEAGLAPASVLSGSSP